MKTRQKTAYMTMLLKIGAAMIEAGKYSEATEIFNQAMTIADNKKGYRDESCI